MYNSLSKLAHTKRYYNRLSISLYVYRLRG